MVMEPAVTSVPGRPMSAWASVLLPEPLGPMITWTSPLRTVRSMPCSTSLPPAEACRPRTSKTCSARHGSTTATVPSSTSTS